MDIVVNCSNIIYRMERQNENNDVSQEEKDNLEMAPEKQFKRFDEVISRTSNIRTSYKAFDTKFGREVAWHVINLADLSSFEIARIYRIKDIMKVIKHKYVMEYLSIWLGENENNLNFITTRLETLTE